MKLEEYLDCVEIGKADRKANLAVFPLYADMKRAARAPQQVKYRLLAEAIKEGSLTISEGKSASVNQLCVFNDSDEKILMLKGETVVGGKQNRMLTANVLLKPKTSVYVPVHCVQQGRWDMGGQDFEVYDMASPSIRHGVAKSNAGSAGQGATWGLVSNFLASSNVRSGSSDYTEVKRQRKNDIGSYVKHFQIGRGQVGMIASIASDEGGKLFLDLFYDERAMAGHFERLISSYAIEALGGLPGNTTASKSRAKEFLSEVAAAKKEISDSLSLGKDIELRDPKIHGAALSYKGIPLYAGALYDGTSRRPIFEPNFRDGPNFFTGGSVTRSRF